METWHLYFLYGETKMIKTWRCPTCKEIVRKEIYHRTGRVEIKQYSCKCSQRKKDERKHDTR